MKEFFSPSKLTLSTVLSIILLIGCKNSNTSDSADNQDLSDSTKVNVNDFYDSLDQDNSTAFNAESLVQTKNTSKLNPAQLSVQKLLETCVQGKYSEAAKFIMYRGKDESRMGQDSFNYSNPNEASTVQITCEVIVAWLGTSKSYEFISYQEEETDFGTQYIVELMFQKEKLGVERHFFYLMNTQKGMMLVNMI